MKAPTNTDIRVAPPDKAAAILRGMGYPIDAKLLRRLYKAGQLPGTFTGKRVLIPIAKAVELLENGVPVDLSCGSGSIHRVEE